MTFRKLLIGFLLVGLFLIAIINFGVGIVTLNSGNNQSIVDSPILSEVSSSLIANQTELQDKTEGQLTNFESENILSVLGELLFFTITKAGTTFAGVIKTFWAITGGLIFNVIFGGGVAFAVVIGTISAIIVITIIFILWRTYKAGE